MKIREAMDFNPLWIIVIVAVGGALIKGLFWLRDVHTAKDGWTRFTTEQFPAFAKEIRGRIDQIFERLPPTPAGVAPGSPLRLTGFGEEMSANMNAQDWAAELAPTLQADLVGKRAFEIDEFSRKYVYEKMRHDPRVSKCMYEMGVERENALRVLYVVLRDQLIATLGVSATDD